MYNDILKTSADDLYELVKSKKKISIEDAAKILKMPMATVHALVDFLVEEKVFGIEYKFTTPYIYISQEYPKKITAAGFSKRMMSKEEFFEKAKKINVSFEEINELWGKYIGENLKLIKDEFYFKAQLRKFTKEETDKLWEKYLTYLR